MKILKKAPKGSVSISKRKRRLGIRRLVKAKRKRGKTKVTFRKKRLASGKKRKLIRNRSSLKRTTRRRLARRRRPNRARLKKHRVKASKQTLPQYASGYRIGFKETYLRAYQLGMQRGLQDGMQLPVNAPTPLVKAPAVNVAPASAVPISPAKQTGFLLWFSGLAEDRKNAISNLVEEKLKASQYQVKVIREEGVSRDAGRNEKLLVKAKQAISNKEIIMVVAPEPDDELIEKIRTEAGVFVEAYIDNNPDPDRMADIAMDPRLIKSNEGAEQIIEYLKLCQFIG